MTTTYEEFVAAKLTFSAHYGHTVATSEVHPALFPHQVDIVRWAVHGGRRGAA